MLGKRAVGSCPLPEAVLGEGTGVSHAEQRLGHLWLSQSVPLAQPWHWLLRGNECGREHRGRAERGVCLINKGCVGDTAEKSVFLTLHAVVEFDLPWSSVHL